MLHSKRTRTIEKYRRCELYRFAIEVVTSGCMAPAGLSFQSEQASKKREAGMTRHLEKVHGWKDNTWGASSLRNTDCIGWNAGR